MTTTNLIDSSVALNAMADFSARENARMVEVGGMVAIISVSWGKTHLNVHHERNGVAMVEGAIVSQKDVTPANIRKTIALLLAA